MSQQLLPLAQLAAAGALGTLARYGVGRGVELVANPDFPWATWVINGSGSLLFGVLYVLAKERGVLSDESRVILLIGFMGAFTTFSSLAFECADLIRAERYTAAAVHLVGQNVWGLGLMFSGFALGRSVA